MPKKKILLTGASGMLGAELCRQFSSDHDVVATSGSGTVGVKADLSHADDVTSLFKMARPEFVIHSAAYSDVDGCERDPERAYRANALAPKHLGAACEKNRVPWIHISTDYVFDGLKQTPYVETDRTFPRNIYGMTKWLGEFYALQGSAQCAVVRTSWLFGPGNPKNFVNMVIEKLLKERAVSVLDDQKDAPTSVKDLGLALKKLTELLLQPRRALLKEVFHICNSGGTTRWEMTQWMNECLGGRAKVEKTDRSQIQGRLALRAPYLVMSNEKFESFAGMKLRPWRESLKEYIDLKEYR